VRQNPAIYLAGYLNSKFRLHKVRNPLARTISRRLQYDNQTILLCSDTTLKTWLRCAPEPASGNPSSLQMT